MIDLLLRDGGKNSAQFFNFRNVDGNIAAELKPFLNLTPGRLVLKRHWRDTDVSAIDAVLINARF